MSQKEHVLLGQQQQQQQQQQQRFQNFVRDTITQLSDTLVDDLQVASCPPPPPTLSFLRCLSTAKNPLSSPLLDLNSFLFPLPSSAATVERMHIGNERVGHPHRILHY
jgi:hypothetical protein